MMNPTPHSNVQDVEGSFRTTILASNDMNNEIELTSPAHGSEQATVPKRRHKFRLFVLMVSLFASLFIAALDQTIVATAIPTISASLNSASGYTWIGGAYLLANAAAAPIWAKLSDIWGRKPILLTAVAWFFVSSIICAVAKNMTTLLVGRALQGTAGGGLLQLVTITVCDLFSMRRRTLYLGLLEFVWCLAAGVGPVVGGAFSQYVSWRYIFWMSLPIAGTTFVILLLFLDVHNPRTGMSEGFKAIDWFGSVSILGLTLMLLLGLNFGGETFPWNSPKVICLIIFGSLMSICFIFSEKCLAKYPLMPLKLFNHRSNIANLVIGFLHGAVFIAGEYYLPLYFQSVKEATPLRSGLLLLPVVLTEAIISILAGIVIHRTGRYREIIWLSLTLMTIGTGAYIDLDVESSVVKIIGFQILAGAGCGGLFHPPLISLQSLIHQDDVATATATFGFLRNIGTSMSVVLGGVVFQNGMRLQGKRLLQEGIPASIAHNLSGADAAANVMIIRTIQDPVQKRLVKDAFVWSLQKMWIMYTCVAFLGLVASAFIVHQTLSKEHTETKTGLKDSKALPHESQVHSDA